MLPHGLYYIPICLKNTQEYINYFKTKEWSNELNRRTIHYGARYSYK